MIDGIHAHVAQSASVVHPTGAAAGAANGRPCLASVPSRVHASMDGGNPRYLLDARDRCNDLEGHDRTA